MTTRETEFRRRLSELMREFDATIWVDPLEEEVCYRIGEGLVCNIFGTSTESAADDIYPEEGR